MKVITYKVTWGEGQQEIVSVRARTITSGFTKALAAAKRGVPRTFGELHSIEFWQVVS